MTLQENYNCFSFIIFLFKFQLLMEFTLRNSILEITQINIPLLSLF